MTLTLAAVYAPIGFIGGLTGALFSEFAMTLAGAVLVSGIVALTLSPMMCSRVLKDSEHQGVLARWLDRRFDWLNYRRVMTTRCCPPVTRRPRGSQEQRPPCGTSPRACL